MSNLQHQKHQHRKAKRRAFLADVQHRDKPLEFCPVTSPYYELVDNTPVKEANLTHNYFMHYASNIAKLSSMQHKHGCIIVHRKKILASAFNQLFDGQRGIHAEIAAIRSCHSCMTNTVMYVVRVAPLCYPGILKYSRPCPNCQKLILKHKIKTVFYSTSYVYDIERDFFV
jgi:deoxycytidylate deaminase